ncbi:putative major facilitator superfamily transporter [Gordonia soli NBRC 108243]|uniref:Putative major facilitator superfamily transporter n=2 Tax=Gordonia soli TaxID=320799 RepID=M0QEU1_9ACTN|nr:putative major facilitator superfamily transporter [Gordonia soli NBRC 108243]
MPALLALGLASFLAVTTEMLPVGLLPALGEAFGTSESRTGALVTVYAAMVAIFSVPLTVATRRVARKPLIVTTVSAYLVSNVMIALAPTFAVVAGGRVVGGLAHALFFSVCIGYVPKVVESGSVGRGLAIVAGGSTAGFVLGVPLSTTLGSLIGWRGAFLTLAVVAAAVVVLVARHLPAVAGAIGVRPARAPGTRGDLATVVTANMLTFVGQYTLYTYVSVILVTAGAAQGWIGPLLLVCGVCGLFGLLLTGRSIDRRQRTVVLTVIALLVAAMVGVGMSMPWLAVVVVAVAVWCGVFGGVPAMFQTAAVRTMADAPEIAGAWINSTANIGIAVGALIGGGVLSTSAGLPAVAGVGAALAATGFVVVLVGTRAFPRA